jgi:hypothetical protein
MYHIYGGGHDEVTKSARKAAQSYFDLSRNNPDVNLYVDHDANVNIAGRSGRVTGPDRALLDAWYDIPAVREQRRQELTKKLLAARNWTRYDAINQVRADQSALALLLPEERKRHEVDMELFAEAHPDYRGELDTLRAVAEIVETYGPDDPEEINKIEHTPERVLEEIDPAEVLARAAAKRERDRAQLAAEQERLGLHAEGKRIGIENLSEAAQERHESNQLAERTGGTTDYESQIAAEREKARQSDLLLQVNQQFRAVGGKFYFKDRQDTVAFKDKGERMITASNEDRVAKAMATMADAKGWKTITVSGHPEFKQQVWMEARMRGIEVRGYKPNERDLLALEEYRDRQMRNNIAHDATHERQTKANARTPAPVEHALLTDRQKIASAVAAALIADRVSNPAQQAVLQKAVDAELRERTKKGKVPNVPVYDKSAPTKTREHTRPQIERTAERTR